MFSTMGHAGPEGRFATAGWISTLINLPGLFLVAFLRLPENVSAARLAFSVHVLQIPFVSYLLFVIARLFKTKIVGRRPKTPTIE